MANMFATLAALLLLVGSAAAQPVLKAGPCTKTRGVYHLSCYAKTITAQVAKNAKLDCFKAWNKPACKAAVAGQYRNAFGCDVAITYNFESQACHDEYQAQEKTNTNCKVYLKAGLGLPINRKTATVLGDYTCPVPRGF